MCGVIVREKGAEYQIRSRMVVGADGAASQMLKLLAESGHSQAAGADEDPDGIWMGVRGYFKGVRLEKSMNKDQYDAGGVFGFDNGAGPAYFWALPVGRDGVKRGLCNVGMMVKGRDVCSSKELSDRLEAWMAVNAAAGGEDEACSIGAMFSEAEQLGTWSFGRLADKTQKRESAGEGYVLVGDAAAQVEPLFGDGLTAAADTAKAAADAIEAAFKADDISASTVVEAYKKALLKLQPEKTEDERKEDRLLMESLADPKVMDKIVEKMGRDPHYRKKI